MIYPPTPKRVYLETYGCQMNVADSELVGGILDREDFVTTGQIADADVVLVNTCAIRENAEQRIYGRLGYFASYKKANPRLVIGVLGCMAERLRQRFVEDEKLVDIVVGPDEYRKLPGMVHRALEGERGIAVRLSRVETYDDIVPLRTEGISAWVSVMRGCDKFCTFCVVPFTRGRERSRSLQGVVREVEELSRQGFKDVTLLGQNVNSYHDGKYDFADLIRTVAAVDRAVRVRFTTSHPRDMSDRLIDAIATTPNVCKYVHLPVQSGSDRILGLMNRTYTVSQYLNLVERIRRAIPGVSLTTDIISGFPTESVKDHEVTKELLERVQYDGAYTFKYSPRENTKSWAMGDDVPDEEKSRRVTEITELQREISQVINSRMAGTIERVLVEGPSRKSERDFTGRTDTNKTAVCHRKDERPGQYVDVFIERANSATLFGRRHPEEQRDAAARSAAGGEVA